MKKQAHGAHVNSPEGRQRKRQRIFFPGLNHKLHRRKIKMKYELNISLTESVLDTIAKAHQRIILVKHTAGDNDTPVACML